MLERPNLKEAVLASAVTNLEYGGYARQVEFADAVWHLCITSKHSRAVGSSQRTTCNIILGNSFKSHGDTLASITSILCLIEVGPLS